jgi:hypothetical protein
MHTECVNTSKTTDTVTSNSNRFFTHTRQYIDRYATIWYSATIRYWRSVFKSDNARSWYDNTGTRKTIRTQLCCLSNNKGMFVHTNTHTHTCNVVAFCVSSCIGVRNKWVSRRNERTRRKCPRRGRTRTRAVPWKCEFKYYYYYYYLFFFFIAITFVSAILFI